MERERNTWWQNLIADSRSSVCLDEDFVSAKPIVKSTVELSTTWPSVLIDNKLKSAMVTFCDDLGIGDATLPAQGLMESVEQF